MATWWHAKLLADHLGDGLVAMAVVRGEADIYAHSAGSTSAIGDPALAAVIELGLERA
jgi:hypothetical protein